MSQVWKIIFSLSFSLMLSIAGHAQTTKPLGGEANTNDVQKQIVEELKQLQNEIALAYNDDKLVERNRLYEILKGARSEAGGKYVADAIWKNWIASAPTAQVGDLIRQAMERRRWHDYEGAREILNKAVKLAPDYSEAWNQRAYILFLQEKFDASLDDLEKALELEPRHFAALSGKARILFHQGRHQLAQKTLKVAVDIHPWIYERFLLNQTPAPGQEPVENRTGIKL